MPVPHIHITCPYPLDSTKGNAVSARRIIGVMTELGYRVTAGTIDEWQCADVHLALHAVRSRAAIDGFLKKCEGGKTAILLTGTDLYRDLPQSGEWDALRRVDRLVVYQESSLESLPEELRAMARVVPKSVEVAVPERTRPTDDGRFVVSQVSHLRATKDPFLVVGALGRLADLPQLEVHHYGDSRAEDYGATAVEHAEREPRYHWHGELPQRDVLQAMGNGDLFLNTSRVEGGANAIAEAIVCGVPVVASSIEPNRGQLGDGHPGLFSPGDVDQLAALLRRAVEDASFVDELHDASVRRQSFFSRASERAGWQALVDELVR
ncbi:glycosyltransferase [Sulfuriroseicoccus oceanibius]|uniref:Glycosyltransferase n=1 Tax=Sulfuriroseicoccus oceanibius TaxID=2707525 RepID=A0A6B3L8J5_9BACT|nr:glycosyltransferase [Sulfuriroseicoccus oceanibius]QQL44693.1 glycosyltransferase [Sulfuriroseicoccus oceanibius]